MMQALASSTSRQSRRARRTLALIAFAVAAPVVLSYLIYHFAPRGSFTNYGELLPTRPVAPLAGQRSDGAAFRLDELKGRWIIVMAAGGRCDEACRHVLYAMRQARTMQGPGAERIERVWLVTDAMAPDAAVLADHPGIIVAHVPASAIDALPRGTAAIHLVDPIGNQVLAWPLRPDIKAVANDLARLLKASRIG